MCPFKVYPQTLQKPDPRDEVVLTILLRLVHPPNSIGEARALLSAMMHLSILHFDIQPFFTHKGYPIYDTLQVTRTAHSYCRSTTSANPISSKSFASAPELGVLASASNSFLSSSMR